MAPLKPHPGPSQIHPCIRTPVGVQLALKVRKKGQAMTILQLQNLDGTLRCCGGFAEHVDGCNFGSRGIPHPEIPAIRIERRAGDTRRAFDKNRAEQHYTEQAFIAEALALMTWVERWLTESRAMHDDVCEDVQREVQTRLVTAQMAATLAKLGGYDGPGF